MIFNPLIPTINQTLKGVQLVLVSKLYPYIAKILASYSRVKLRIIDRTVDIETEYLCWKHRKGELIEFGTRGYKTKLEDLGLLAAQVHLVRKKAESTRHEVVIADVDHDGFLISRYGPIDGVPTISAEQAMPRKRFELEIVSIDGYIGVKKHFAGNKAPFLRELSALHVLGQKHCKVPAIMAIDFENTTITMSYISGVVLREELGKRGAVLRDRDVNKNAEFAGLSSKEQWMRRICEGRKVLYEVVDRQFVDDLFNELKRVHSAGFVLNDIKYGNVVIEKKSQEPYIIDFDHARHASKVGLRVFQYQRDLEIERFNLHYDVENINYSL